MSRRLRILHAIHDFLPRHRAGSEIYAFDLARAQMARHDVFVLAAEYDPAAAHGTLRWRTWGRLAVIEIVNNWECDGFADSYRSPRMNQQIGHALDAIRPDVVHVHSLLNLSFDLPRLARERGASVVATLHDHTLVCPSGGQRVHVAEAHVCAQIDPERCSRCFVQSPLYGQMAAGRVTRVRGGRAAGRAALLLRRLAPSVAAAAARTIDAGPVSPADIETRLADVAGVFGSVDLFVAPSPSIGAEFVRLGLDPRRLDVSDYGFAPMSRGGPAAPRVTSRPAARPLRAGFVGTLVWHKGAHVLVEAAALLAGAVEVHVHGDTAVFPSYVASLRQRATGLPVTFHGGFDRSTVADVYASFDVLVVPSLWPENSPLVIHEAFMLGVPVIGTRIGGTADLVRDQVDGLLVEPFSAVSLAAGLQRLVSDPALLARLSGAAPDVKSIADDAAEWDARYDRVRQARLAPAS